MKLGLLPSSVTKMEAGWGGVEGVNDTSSVTALVLCVLSGPLPFLALSEACHSKMGFFNCNTLGRFIFLDGEETALLYWLQLHSQLRRPRIFREEEW